MTKRYCLLLDLVEDPKAIIEYEKYHCKVWPEIIRSIHDSGILSMEIFRYGNRLAMVMDVDESFSMDKKAQMDAENLKVQEWERLMWRYQQAIPGANKDEKWVLTKKIFDTSGYE